MVFLKLTIFLILISSVITVHSEKEYFLVHSKWNKMKLFCNYKFFRHLFECASSCTSKYYCSAFWFDENQNICQLGTKDNLQASELASADTIPIYTNPNYVDTKGNIFSIYNLVYFNSRNTYCKCTVIFLFFWAGTLGCEKI